jgi:hypothetical protein
VAFLRLSPKVGQPPAAVEEGAVVVLPQERDGAWRGADDEFLVHGQVSQGNNPCFSESRKGKSYAHAIVTAVHAQTPERVGNGEPGATQRDIITKRELENVLQGRGAGARDQLPLGLVTVPLSHLDQEPRTLVLE